MNSSLALHEAFLSRWPLKLWQEATVVVGVSGGADSTALLRLVLEIRPLPSQTIVAHFNHGLRGVDSDDDQKFVEDCAARFGVRCVSCKATTSSVNDKNSENRLRTLRHQFLTRVASDNKASWIAMAHHADDQVETFLHNLLRGSGPSGLSGIPTMRTVSPGIQLVRPLLDIPRSELVEYLDSKQQTFRIDQSNDSDVYTRNRIRNSLLPLLRTFMGSETLDRRLAQACHLIAEEHAVVVSLAENWLKEIGMDERADADASKSVTSGFSIPQRTMVDTSWPVVRHALTVLWHQMEWPLREMSHLHWDRLRRFLAATTQSTHAKRTDLPGSIVVRYRKGIVEFLRVLPDRESN